MLHYIRQNTTRKRRPSIIIVFVLHFQDGLKKEALLNEQSQTVESTEDVSPDFCEGLIRMLSSLYGHTASNVLSSTMAAKLLADESIFSFSHEFKSIPLKHLIEWSEGTEHLDFKLRKVKNGDGNYDHVQDTFIKNIDIQTW